MSMEESIRQIIREENERHLQDIEKLLESHGYRKTPRFLKVPEAAEILRIGKTATYELCQQSEHNGFPCVRDGHKIRIPYNALMNWIDQQTNQAI
ncbi:helix-turn-helix domain-containing protein [Oceanobacillus alkalisoli]|uniref:helix-turn-helix domain-containing protein n=1 Tax=Oceanobacillus alkalisoli TaxID=2925113 RepID=UPI001EF0DF61|nr:helix-turn-helix domain-containing protein [Oceanobacillus alkalisoli]MCF3942168.1 helix-turn-helix domain-containing protein [Oceanobacillus alkalisoli]MCG5104400.1 helix-turn-helix domain-containing protein [Oceanobacillus alkalisoli]